jgi:imidazole glycerol-phosphate synthase subunit HisH
MSGVALIDYGAGNLQSVRNALKAAGASDVAVTANPMEVLAGKRIVLPGVGAFAHCMGALSGIPGMIDALNEAVIVHGRPFLGICVGMQLMADEGREHGKTPGLGWIGGAVAAIAPQPGIKQPGIKVPHMGWNDVITATQHPVIDHGEAYFLHSYAFEGDHILATTDHGGSRVAAIGRDNMLGVQFHPEKSQSYGIAMLQRFLKWRP